MELSLGCGAYDRTIPLQDGTISPKGLTLRFSAMRPGELFRKQAREATFDVSEFSLSTFAILQDRGDRRFVAIPVFPSKMFRHRSIFINTSAGISTPAGLRGKRVGVQEFQQTAGVWVRGILEHEYGVHPSEIEWYVGGYARPQKYEPRIPLTLPPSVRTHPISSRTSLDRMLERGQIDAAIGAEAPPSYLRRSRRVARLFPDYPAIEADYFRRTHIFPVMHLVVLRREIYDEHRWVARSLFDAFGEAKRLGLSRLSSDATPYCALPWLQSNLETATEILGKDAYAYGLRANRRVLDTFLRYAREQGLISSRMRSRDLFVPELLDT